MVPKKDGSYRFVIDFRGVNARFKRVCYPLPNISHILDNLGNAKYLSSLDIRSAYWEIPLEKDSRPLTAFSVAGRGQFQFKRMPFGLHSATGTFQALVDRPFTPDLEPYHSHLYLQAVKLKLATPLSRLQVGLRSNPLKAPYLVNSFFGR
jgi:hypothetical protein